MSKQGLFIEEGTKKIFCAECLVDLMRPIKVGLRKLERDDLLDDVLPTCSVCHEALEVEEG